ncbi:MAG: GNAT family N-acetyltransferase [Bacilli bacterium]|nr:GNAT family N-acetyltransferase [Bacilli bacterium]
MKYIIRKRKKEDCISIANIVTIAWNETYKGIVPDWFLEELKNNEDDRIKKAYDEFDMNNNNQLVLEVDNKVVGFVNYGKSEDNEFNNCGEIFALYIISKYKGNGFGRKLVSAAIKELKSLGFDKMIIACLKGNPSNEFYKHIGGVYIKDGIYKRLNLPENIYYYENI